jgi:hypothetical protein
MKKVALLGVVVVVAAFAVWRLIDARSAESAAKLPVIPAAAQDTQPSTPPASSKHSITIQFNYDFKATPICSDKVKTKCVSQFVVYDISNGAKAYKLTSFPPPANADGAVQGIKYSTPPRVFESGKHQIAVAASDANGVESNRYAASVWVVIP